MNFQIHALPAANPDDARAQSRKAIEAMTDAQLLTQCIAVGGAISALHMLMTIGCTPTSLLALQRGQEIMAAEVERAMAARGMKRTPTHEAPEARQ